MKKIKLFALPAIGLFILASCSGGNKKATLEYAKSYLASVEDLYDKADQAYYDFDTSLPRFGETPDAAKINASYDEMNKKLAEIKTKIDALPPFEGDKEEVKSAEKLNKAVVAKVDFYITGSTKEIKEIKDLVITGANRFGSGPSKVMEPFEANASKLTSEFITAKREYKQKFKTGKSKDKK
jgi:hypothetical protein